MQVHLHVQRLVEERGKLPYVLQVRGLGRRQGQHSTVLDQEVVVLLYVELELLKGKLAVANAHDKGVVKEPVPQIGVLPPEMLCGAHRSNSSRPSSPRSSRPPVLPCTSSSLPGFSPA